MSNETIDQSWEAAETAIATPGNVEVVTIIGTTNEDGTITSTITLGGGNEGDQASVTFDVSDNPLVLDALDKMVSILALTGKEISRTKSDGTPYDA